MRQRESNNLPIVLLASKSVNVSRNMFCFCFGKQYLLRPMGHRSGFHYHLSGPQTQPHFTPGDFLPTEDVVSENTA